MEDKFVVLFGHRRKNFAIVQNYIFKYLALRESCFWNWVLKSKYGIFKPSTDGRTPISSKEPKTKKLRNCVLRRTVQNSQIYVKEKKCQRIPVIRNTVMKLVNKLNFGILKPRKGRSDYM